MQLNFITHTFDFNLKKDPQATLVTDPQTLIQMFNTLRASKIISYDTETSGLDWAKDSKMCGVSFGTEVAGVIKSWYVPFRHIDGSKQLDINIVSPAIKAILEDPSRLIICHNIKFDDHISSKEGWYLGDNRYDTQIGAYFYNENDGLSLKHRAAVDLQDPQAMELKDLVDLKVANLAYYRGGTKKDYEDSVGYSEIPVGLLGIYACLDAKYTYQLYKFYEDKHQISKTYAKVFQTETKLTKVITDMEQHGIKINIDFLADIEKKMAIKLQTIDAQIHKILGNNYFNVASDTELPKYLIRTMGLKLTKKTKKGNNFSVDGEVLRSFKDKDSSGLLDCILRFRTFDKLHSTFVIPILNFVDSNNVLHGSFKQLGTVNGRLSCNKPNLQNIARKEFELEGEESTLRKVFITSSKDRILTLYDYSQIELRIMAFYSRDPIMTNVYLNNGDIHGIVAKEVGVTRDEAKAINFGLNYGMAANGLSKRIGTSLEVAEKYLQTYFKRFQGVANFKVNFINLVKRQNGYFQNCFGRPRRVKNILSSDGYTRGAAERQAVSSLIAGTAAELTKESLVKISDFIDNEKIDAHLNNTIHDEIWIEGDIKETAKILSNTKKIMENYPEFAPIPIQVSCFYTTTNWEDKKEIK